MKTPMDDAVKVLADLASEGFSRGWDKLDRADKLEAIASAIGGIHREWVLLKDELTALRAQLADARQKAKECTAVVMAFSMNPDNTSLAFRVGVATRRLEDALAEPELAS